MDKKNHLAELLEKKYHLFVYKKIFKILDTEDFTSNSNGIFISLNNIPDKNIDDCINFIKDIDASSLKYIESENTRERDIQKVKETVKKPLETKQKSKKNTCQKLKKPLKKPTSDPKVFKRLRQCMGRGYSSNVQNLEIYKGDSDDDLKEEKEEESEIDEDLGEVELEDDYLTQDKTELKEIDFKELGLEDSDDNI